MAEPIKDEIPCGKVIIGKIDRWKSKTINSKVKGSWRRRLLAVAGEVTQHGRAHPYSWLITIVSLGSKQSEESHRSE
jgi:hypothetical protein